MPVHRHCQSPGSHFERWLDDRRGPQPARKIRPQRPGAEPGRERWQYLRQNWLSNTVFENYDAIVDAAGAVGQKAHRSTRNDHLHRNARLGSI